MPRGDIATLETHELDNTNVQSYLYSLHEYCGQLTLLHMAGMVVGGFKDPDRR